jgi:HAD superfamily hydrolase (TIGR01509 family)
MGSGLRAIFFDAGNTLVYPRLEQVAEDLTRQGYPASVEDFHAAERVGKRKLDDWLWPQIRQGEVPRTIDSYYWREYLQALLERIGVPEAEREAKMRAVIERFREITLWSRVYPDTAPVLAALRAQGYLLGVISNSIGTIEQQLTRVGLGGEFRAIIDSAHVGVEKPHPEIFQIALARLGVAAQEAVFVGDTYATDVGGAQLAGLGGVLIDRVGAYPDAECPRIRSLAELPKVLETSAAKQGG